MRCGTSDEKRDAATGQKNPAFGGPLRLIGGPGSFLGGACPMPTSRRAPRLTE